MTPRERLLAAVKREKTDRVPVSVYELSGFNSRAWENSDPSYAALMSAIREKTDCVCMWDMRSDMAAALSAYPVKTNVREKHGSNFTDTFLTMHTPKGPLTSSHRIYSDAHTRWTTEHWCKSAADVDALLSVPFEPVTYDPADYARIRREVGDNGIVMSTIDDPAGFAMLCMEFGGAMVWAMTETGHFARAMDEIHRRGMVNLENLLKTQTVDLYRICGSETLTPPYMPPEYFRRFVTPYVREMTALIHRYGGLARIHCHGRINDALDEILSCGADALDPCEAPPDGNITLRELKRRTAGRLCLFGNLQAKLLEWGTPGEVREAVKRCMDDAMEGGGYVVMPTSAPINTPLTARAEENYLAFIEAAHEHGRY
jgi:uroporphyrinogen-III decarboxylase